MAQSNLTLSADGLAALIAHEALIDGLYDDDSGYATFGVGHLVHPTHKWPSFLLKAARADPAWSSSVKERKWSKTKSTFYLERAAVAVTGFDQLQTKAAELGRDIVAGRKQFGGKTYAQLTAAQQAIVDGVLDDAVRVEVDMLARKADQVLAQDAQRFEQAVRDKVTRNLDQDEFDALVSFTFNVGVGNFGASTLLKRINDGSYRCGTAAVRRAAIVDVEAQFKKWNKSGGVVLKGLTTRRQDEANLFLGPARQELQELEDKERMRRQAPQPSLPLNNAPSWRVPLP